MQKLIKKITNALIKERIVCPCGFKTTSEARALAHLAKHPNELGSINEAGSVVWANS